VGYFRNNNPLYYRFTKAEHSCKLCYHAIEQILKHISELEHKNFKSFLNENQSQKVQSSVRPFQFLADFRRGEEDEEMAADRSTGSFVSSSSHNILFSRNIHLHPSTLPIKQDTCMFEGTVK